MPVWSRTLIAFLRAAKSQMEVNHGGKYTVESVQNEKYFTKSGDFLFLLLTFACVIDVLLE